jgi:hypothetical protein
MRERSSNEYKMNKIDENKLVHRHYHPLISGCTCFNYVSLTRIECMRVECIDEQ